MGVSPIELALRQQIMAALVDRVSRNGGVISRKELSAFKANGQVHRLIDVGKGIWNPRSMAVTLSIVSTPQGPYDDEDVEGGLLRYQYRQGSTAGDNSKLRAAAGTGVPLILLRWIADGVYVPVFPVFIVGDDPSTRSVMVALDESLRFIADVEHPSEDQRRYVERIAKVRLHQVGILESACRAGQALQQTDQVVVGGGQDPWRRQQGEQGGGQQQRLGPVGPTRHSSRAPCLVRLAADR
jgi:putative restriction endonuclease